MAIAYLKNEQKKNRKRRGRGNASGLGGECGRGHKGQKSRSGYSRQSGFEGGQTPLYRRLPKANGFNNIRFKTVYDIISFSDLNNFKNDSVIKIQDLIDKKLVTGKYPIKLLANGKLKVKVELHINKVSAKAKKDIEDLSGSVTIV
tara:strand:+ start:1175 stop:1612 length:438 start_codon:yes stop_codon:yes gene_type:complete